eukprot:TRINITY_DN13577_c0_g1_i2.p1 TRINITY_DN13577_c0_g1~~TRINITY_DN13577_c0_g1_i2.p1  ORF type:complete len:638 (+),score=140.00 TRINITY_DN13577_c0_g1_i2:75-1988(+)
MAEDRALEALLRKHSDAVFHRLDTWLEKQQSLVNELLGAAQNHPGGLATRAETYSDCDSESVPRAQPPMNPGFEQECPGGVSGVSISDTVSLRDLCEDMDAHGLARLPSNSEPVNDLYKRSPGFSEAAAVSASAPLPNFSPKQVQIISAASLVSDEPTDRAGSKSYPPFFQKRLLSRGDTYMEAKKEGERRLIEKAKARETHSYVGETSRKAIRSLVSSWAFEMFFALVIVSNSVFLGVQVEFTANTRSDVLPEGFFAAQAIYAALFTVELLLRWISEGFTRFFTSATAAWNILDLIVAAMSLFEVVFAVATEDYVRRSNPGSNLRILRVLRITRLIRVVRIIKVVRFIRALRTLLYSIMNTLKCLAWAMLLQGMIMYIFAIVLTDAVVMNFLLGEAQLSPEATALLELRFGSLHRSVQTLFRSVSGGLSFSDTVDALEQVDMVWAYIFLAYITFSVFAVLNVMTGVFCQSAIKGAERDQELIIQQIIAERQKYMQSLENLFKAIDDDNSGFITIDEFEEHFHDQSVQAFFQALELEATDAWTLFRNLDLNGDHSLDAEEFMEGCLQLRGTARSIEMAAVKKDSRLMATKVKYLLDAIGRIEDALKSVDPVDLNSVVSSPKVQPKVPTTESDKQSQR